MLPLVQRLQKNFPPAFRIDLVRIDDIFANLLAQLILQLGGESVILRTAWRKHPGD